MNRLLAASHQLISRFWRLLFLLMLALLHLASLRGAGDVWARGLMVAHFGLFIIWQPFMRGEQRLSTWQSLGIISITFGILAFLNWWILALWISVLAGIVGGKVFLFQARWLRRFYLMVFLYLVSLLLVWIVPNSFTGMVLPVELRMTAQYGLPLLFIVMLALPVEADSAETPQIVDFFYATLIFLLLVVLALGSLAFMTVAQFGYVNALIATLLIIATVLVVLSLAWNPRAGFSGLSMYFSRYLLSIGLPFEQWLFFLAELSQLESKPERFLKEACLGLSRLPWVTGGMWRAAGAEGRFGAESPHSVEYTNQELHLRVYAGSEPSPSLLWHFNLLGQLLGEFYVAKLREQKLQQQTYVQAVHETGARMTHDIKNLLQSLSVLTAAAERTEPGDSAELTALMRRQLPVIRERLQMTLDKLQKPQTESGRFLQAGAWWEALQRSYASRQVEFVSLGISPEVLLPKELFDGAGDNLLQNALRKRKLDDSLKIRVEFRCGEDVELRVADTGKAVAKEVLSGLLRGPVPSEAGFGIGLYQVARLAEIAGYALRLERNRPGDVSFVLSGSATGR